MRCANSSTDSFWILGSTLHLGLSTLDFSEVVLSNVVLQILLSDHAQAPKESSSATA